MASLKDQLDQAGYDTSNLDEAAVLKQLSDAGYDTSSFTPSDQGVAGAVGSAIKRLLPSKETLETPMRVSSKLGTMVEAGGAGLGELEGNYLKHMANLVPGVNIPVESPSDALMQAAQNVRAVQSGLSPDTTAGKAGKFVGSFFTPNQIALTATGEAAAAPVIKGLSKGANYIGELLAPASEEALPGAAKAAGNVLSTVSGVGTPELETVMGAGREAVQGAKTFPQLAESVAESMNKLTKHVDTLEKVANGALDAEKTLPLSTMTDAIDSEVKALKAATVPTQATESATETLEGMLEKLKNRKDLTEPEVAKWVKDVQGKINWNDPLGTELNEALTRIQNAVNDSLKTANPAYAKAESAFADAVNLKNDLADAMGVEKGTGFKGTFEPKNVSVTKLKGLLNPDNALQTKKLLGQLSQVPGMPNYVDLAKQASAKAAINSGFRSRLAGLLAGMVPGAGEALKSAGNAAFMGAPSAANAVYQGLTQ